MDRSGSYHSLTPKGGREDDVDPLLARSDGHKPNVSSFARLSLTEAIPNVRCSEPARETGAMADGPLLAKAATIVTA